MYLGVILIVMRCRLPSQIGFFTPYNSVQNDSKIKIYGKTLINLKKANLKKVQLRFAANPSYINSLITIPFKQIFESTKL